MATNNKEPITIQADIQAPVETVWKVWGAPEHITQWCSASDDWHAPYADNDLQTGGRFRTTMAAKDGSFSFEFEGVYTEVDPYKKIAYTMPDDRKVEANFQDLGDNQTRVIQTFDPEASNPVEMQREGWQAILNRFKRYTESLD